uniref:Uncharacterized protein n=1 Tax=viral metagenome TaxID=1070528 RepID=A0A6M3L627_9ZZZZ
MTTIPYAEDINYWKTSRSSPDDWIDKASAQIEKLGGHTHTHAFGKDNQGNSAYMLQFSIGEDNYKILWPVLLSKTNNENAAKIQAATLLYHDVKNRCLTAMILGNRTAFFNYFLLPDGRTIIEASVPELMHEIPLVLAGFKQLNEG